MRQPIITLVSDFGLKDPYVAEMKAVILTICPEAKIIDISHNVDKFDIRMGAFLLASAAPYFPDGTVHVAVVDPGVGTKRRPIVVKTKRSYFVGPDNGVLMLAASKRELEHVYVIENPQYICLEISKTFHGRDVFAPVAAYVAKGCVVSEFGKEIKDYVAPAFAEPRFEESVIFGEVLHVDDFGNIVTNISLEVLEKLAVHENEPLKIEVGEGIVTLKLCSAYCDASLGEALAIIGSHNFLEISVNQGDAARRFKAESGDSVSVQPMNHG